MAISTQQQAEIARMLGFPSLLSQASLQLGYPYYSSQLAMWQPYAVLIARLSSCAPADEVTFFGAESALFGQFFTPASLQIVFSTPSSIAANVNVQLNLDGNPIAVTTASGETPATLAAKFVLAIQQSTAALQDMLPNSIGPSIFLYPQSLGVDGNGKIVMLTSSDASLLVAIGAQTPAQFIAGMTAGGANPPGPYYLASDANQPLYGYVPIIRQLESDIIGSKENLDILTVDVYSPRQDEMQERARLWTQYRRELADRLSVPLDPDLTGNRSNRAQRVV